MAESRDARPDRGRAGRRGRPRWRPSCASSCCASPTCRRELAPDGLSDADNPIVKGPVNLPDAYPSTSGCRTGRRRPRSASSTTSGPPRSAGRCSPCRAGSGRRCSRALCQLALDRNADAFEEIRPPTLVTTATLTATGQLPEVRRRRLRHRARRPVVHPDGRGAAHVARRRRDPRRGRPADADDGVHAVLPARGRLGRAGTRGACCARHEFDKVEILAYATPEQAPAMLDELVAPGRGDHRRARPAVPHHRDLHRRPRPEPPPQLRHRGLRAGRRRVARGRRRSAGSATTRPAGPTSATGPPGEKGTADRAHAQRLGARRAPGVGGDHRELPPARRQHRPARGAVAVPARAPAGPMPAADGSAWATDGPGRPAVATTTGAPSSGDDLDDDPIAQWWALVRRGGGRRARRAATPCPSPRSADDGGPDARLRAGPRRRRAGVRLLHQPTSRPRPGSWRRDPAAAAMFGWLELHRQVRVRGTVEPVAPAEADAYFASRPRASPHRRVGVAAVAGADRPGRARRRGRRGRGPLPGDDVPRPPHWGGLRVVPLGDRVLAGPPEPPARPLPLPARRPGDGWIIERLAP